MCAWAAAGLPVATARDAGLVVHRTAPLNCETSIPALIGGVVMPNARFYVRNHFDTPALDTATWRLAIAGLVERPLRLSLRDLQNMRSHTLVVTLECAGNGRSMFQPPVEGEPWHLGAVSTAEWTGVPLADVLDRAGPAPGAREVIFRGADVGSPGSPAGSPEPVRFERSLPISDARGPEALLAYAMNGDPLPIEHGYPLRLIVPGWYAVASVKWLTGIEVTGSPFEGFFQTSRYVYEWDRGGRRCANRSGCNRSGQSSPSRPAPRRSPPASWSSAVWRGRGPRRSPVSISASATAHGSRPGLSVTASATAGSGGSC